MAVDSTTPDIPAMRVIPATRLLPMDELRGHYEHSRKAWIVYPWPIAVHLARLVGDSLMVSGRLVGSPRGSHVVKRVDASEDVLITFRKGGGK